MFAVDTSAPDPTRWGRPRQLFDRAYFAAAGPTSYDAAPDGRLLLLKESSAPAPGQATEVRMVQHWTDELKRLAPVR